jgi:hypothetical protein
MARPPPSSALGAPARHGRADAGQQPQINVAHSEHGRVLRDSFASLDQA